jgi:hypothetical protein
MRSFPQTLYRRAEMYAPQDYDGIPKIYLESWAQRRIEHLAKGKCRSSHSILSCPPSLSTFPASCSFQFSFQSIETLTVQQVAPPCTSLHLPPAPLPTLFSVRRLPKLGSNINPVSFTPRRRPCYALSVCHLEDRNTVHITLKMILSLVSSSRVVRSFLVSNRMAQPDDANSQSKLICKYAIVQDVEHFHVIAWAYQSCDLADFEKTLEDTSEGSHIHSSPFNSYVFVKFSLPLP